MLLEELGYISGVIDGEGHITFFSKTNRYSSMHVGISNTNVLIINKCMDILKKVGCNPKVYFSNPNPSRWKAKMTILLTNQADCLKFLKTIVPYLAGKKERALLAIRYIESRQRRISSSPSGVCKNTKLNEEEEKMISQIRSLNRRGPNGV